MKNYINQLLAILKVEEVILHLNALFEMLI